MGWTFVGLGEGMLVAPLMVDSPSHQLCCRHRSDLLSQFGLGFRVLGVGCEGGGLEVSQCSEVQGCRMSNPMSSVPSYSSLAE